MKRTRLEVTPITYACIAIKANSFLGITYPFVALMGEKRHVRLLDASISVCTPSSDSLTTTRTRMHRVPYPLHPRTKCYLSPYHLSYIKRKGITRSLAWVTILRQSGYFAKTSENTWSLAYGNDCDRKNKMRPYLDTS